MLLVADRLGVYNAKVVETTSVAGRNLSGSLPDALSTASLVLEALAVALVWVLYARARDERARLPLAFAAAVAGLLAFTKVFSPQYLVWLVPLVVIAGSSRGGRADRRLAPARPGLVLPLPRALPDRVADLAPARAQRPRGGDLRGARRGACARSARRWKTRIPSRSKTSRQSGLRRSQESWTAVGKGASRSA